MTNKPRDRKAPSTKGGAKKATPSAKGKKHQDELLDEGVEETFPASDPVAVRITR